MTNKVSSTVDNGYWQLANSTKEEWLQIIFPYNLQITQAYVTTRPRDNYSRTVKLYTNSNKQIKMGSLTTSAALTQYSFNLGKIYMTNTLYLVVTSGSQNSYFGLQNLQLTAKLIYKIYI